jgi:acyl-CoA hydrolase
MLNDNQIRDLWDRMLAAETRTLYFADLSNRYTQLKQVITGVSFFLSSAAAATIIAKLPYYIPLGLSVVVALMTAYSFATDLDRRIGTAVKLHSQWHQISDQYGNLWNHTYADDAEEQFEEISARERELSELATTEMPNPDWKRLEKWQQNVFRLRHLTN